MILRAFFTCVQTACLPCCFSVCFLDRVLTCFPCVQLTCCFFAEPACILQCYSCFMCSALVRSSSSPATPASPQPSPPGFAFISLRHRLNKHSIICSRLCLCILGSKHKTVIYRIIWPLMDPTETDGFRQALPTQGLTFGACACAYFPFMCLRLTKMRAMFGWRALCLNVTLYFLCQGKVRSQP